MDKLHNVSHYHSAQYESTKINYRQQDSKQIRIGLIFTNVLLDLIELKKKELTINWFLIKLNLTV